jgi:predicted phosphoribosyltransferase
MRLFQGRREAGRVLAALLTPYGGRTDVLVLGLPRGGVPVAFEIARALDVPLDVLLVRKLGVPGHEELAMGAIASGGIRILNEAVVLGLLLPEDVLDRAAAQEQEVLERRSRAYRGDRPFPDVRGKTIIVVDDGLATGSTMRVAIAALRRHCPARIVVAVPTAPEETCAEVAAVADECVCADTPEWFYAVGQSYVEFPQVSDAEVRDLLQQAPQSAARDRAGS